MPSQRRPGRKGQAWPAWQQQLLRWGRLWQAARQAGSVAQAAAGMALRPWGSRLDTCGYRRGCCRAGDKKRVTLHEGGFLLLIPLRNEKQEICIRGKHGLFIRSRAYTSLHDTETHTHTHIYTHVFMYTPARKIVVHGLRCFLQILVEYVVDILAALPSIDDVEA